MKRLWTVKLCPDKATAHLMFCDISYTYKPMPGLGDSMMSCQMSFTCCCEDRKKFATHNPPCKTAAGVAVQKKFTKR